MVSHRTAITTRQLRVLEQHPDLRLLVSHMGLPDAATGDEDDLPAGQKLADVLPLAKYPGVHIKLSGFYALATPDYGYPHTATHPFVKTVLDAFGDDRLLWGSDFPPSLDFITLKQTLGMFDHMAWLDSDSREKIVGANLMALIDDARSCTGANSGKNSPPCKASADNSIPSVAELLGQLVAIPSVNPAFIKGAEETDLATLTPIPVGAEALAGEVRMAETVAKHLDQLGAEVHWDNSIPGRPAVFGIIRGSDSNKKMVGIDVHLDTVAVEGCTDPFSGQVDHATGRLHGRGYVTSDLICVPYVLYGLNTST